MSLIKHNCKIILASNSQVRAQMMKDTNLEFDIKSPNFDEELFKDNNNSLAIKDLALELARNKALSISRIKTEELVIGSDQICEVDHHKIDKSRNKSDAIKQLMLMSNKTHFQNNAVVIAQNNKIIFENYTRVRLVMHNLTKSQITSYVEADLPIGCAGSYKYESLGKILFKEVEGDHFSILGMNIQTIISFLFKNNFIKI